MLKQDKLAVVRAFSKEYRKGRKKGKSLLLTKLTKITGYSRKHLSDYQNFFQPVMRLREKVRNGTRLTRRYDKPKTAYQRVLGSPDINPEVKEKLKKRFLTLNPKGLLLEITRLGRKLVKK